MPGRVWLDWNANGGLSELEYGRNDRIVPDGLLDVYGSLAAALAADHEVVELAYDWRRPIEDGAARLADVVKEALERRAESGAAVRLVAHSSGGLLVRAMQWVSAATWRRFAEAAGSRVLLLGPPNGGTWMPMQLLTRRRHARQPAAVSGAAVRDRRGPPDVRRLSRPAAAAGGSGMGVRPGSDPGLTPV